MASRVTGWDYVAIGTGLYGGNWCFFAPTRDGYLLEVLTHAGNVRQSSDARYNQTERDGEAIFASLRHGATFRCIKGTALGSA